jgi:hypothetical protein
LPTALARQPLEGLSDRENSIILADAVATQDTVTQPVA